MSQLSILEKPLSYEDLLDGRKAEEVDLVVIHCTELPDLETAREYGERICYEQSGTGNSGHFYIDRDGATERWVDPLRVAHHVRQYNQRSIGIELVNRGRWPHWYSADHQSMREAYPQAQVSALISLLERLNDELPSLRWIAGHEELDREQVPANDSPGQLIYRKRDPGPQFPWHDVLARTSLVKTNQAELS